MTMKTKQFSSVLDDRQLEQKLQNCWMDRTGRDRIVVYMWRVWRAVNYKHELVWEQIENISVITVRIKWNNGIRNDIITFYKSWVWSCLTGDWKRMVITLWIISIKIVCSCDLQGGDISLQISSMTLSCGDEEKICCTTGSTFHG